MKKFAFAFAVVGAMALAGCDSGPSCKKTTCAPACDPTKQFCDTSNFTCTDYKTCTPACDITKNEVCDQTKGSCITFKNCSPACKTDGSEICDTTSGTCKAVPVVKTCSPACTGIQVCVDGECKDNCNPVCDITKGETCVF